MYKRSFLFLSLSLAGTTACANNNLDELMSMSLEELSMLNVTMETASKFSQNLTDIPASVYVLSGDRILRSGASSIAEALSLVPGMYFSKWNENLYHVSSRGFHDGLFNKMLVMVDGRSVYSPVYGGVYWSTLDYILADIDRIEVLRGPSGSIWGGNASNGVINIITKSTKDTQGTYVSGTAGKYSAYDVSVRHGVKLSEDISSRVYFKRKRNPNYLSDSSRYWTSETAGFVLEGHQEDADWNIRAGGTKTSTVQTAFSATYDPNNPLAPVLGVNVRDFEDKTSSVYAQLSYSKRLDSGNVVSGNIWADHVKDSSLDAPGEYTTIDIDFNYLNQINERHTMSFGAGLRHVGMEFGYSWWETDLYQSSYYSRMYHIGKASDYIGNVFAQSDYQWSPEVRTVLGVKAEHFDQNTTTELSPQLRVLFSPSKVHSFWAGVGRGVVSPSYMDSEATYQEVYTYFDGVDTYGQTYLTLPNKDLTNESVVTYELGWRFIPSADFEVDTTAFYSQHKNLRGGDCNDSLYAPGYEHLWFCFISDDYSAVSQGVELAAQYKFTEDLTFFASYSYLTLGGKWEGGALSNGASAKYFSLPSQHLATLQTLWNVTQSWQWDFVIRYNNTSFPHEVLDDFAGLPSPTLHDVEPHLTVDSRLGWQATPNTPLIEVIAKKIGSNDLHDSWGLYANEEQYSVRLSYEF